MRACRSSSGRRGGSSTSPRPTSCRAVRSAPRRPARSRRSLVVHRGKTAFALLNKYPYSSGHLMLAPYAHVGRARAARRRDGARAPPPRAREPGRPAHALPAGRLQPRHQHRPRGRRGHPRARAHARRPALGRRHELHARAGRREGDAGAPARDAGPPARGLARLTLDAWTAAKMAAPRGRSSVGRASASQAEGRGFEPHRPLERRLAQAGGHWVWSHCWRPSAPARKDVLKRDEAAGLLAA